MFERFYGALKGNGFAFGTHCWSADPGLYEICGPLGYDYIWIDNEHGGMTLPMIDRAVLASRSQGVAAVVRVPGHIMETVKPVLEMGPQGIIFPMVNTAAQAELVASHCKYPPKGTRSYGPLRASDYFTMPMERYVREAGNILCFIQCEHVESVRNLDEILEVPGVDVVICGPMDLSSSIGKLGRTDDPEVVGLMDTVIQKCREHKKAFGLSTNDWELSRYWLERGASFVSCGNVYDAYIRMSRLVMEKVNDLRTVKEG